MKYNYDLVVIGGGSGGVRAARWSAALGAKVALCESDRMGGTCVIRGCIPKKLMVYGAAFPKHFMLAKAYGWKVKKPSLNWSTFNRARNQEIKRLENVYQNILKKSSVKVFSGAGSLQDSHTVQVHNRNLTSRYILIATGAKPRQIDITGSKLALTSDDMFSLSQQPKSLLVLGSGYIALEFASIFHGLGTHVQVLFRSDKILKGFDLSIRQNLQDKLSSRGIQFLSRRQVVSIQKTRGGNLSVWDNKKGKWQASKVLMALGRVPNTLGLNLKSVGIKINKEGAIVVNNQFETSCSGVFAIGDVASTPYSLTPVAIAEGMFLSEMLFKKTNQQKNKKPVKPASSIYKNVPTAVFTSPPASTVGLTEQEALARGLQLEIYESHFRPLKQSLTTDTERTYIKLIVCKKTRKVLGVHIIGEMAGEMLQGFAVAVKAGLTKEHLDQTIGIHPTSAEELVTMR